MPLELTVTAQGRVTLPEAMMNHLGVKPGDKIKVELMAGGKMQLAQAPADDIRQLRGVLRRPGQPAISLEQMREAIGSGRQR